MDTSDDKHSRPSDTQTPQASDDPTASLRAAALRTLKAKRRKPITSEAPPSIPPRSLTAQTSSITLDYGEQDSSPRDTSTVPKRSSSPVAQPMNVDDTSMREEGEISDSDTLPAPSKPLRDTPLSVSRPSPKSHRYKRSPTPRRSPDPGPSTLVKADSLTRGLPPSPQRSTHPLTPVPPLEQSPHIDEGYARPGLASTFLSYILHRLLIMSPTVTQAQYDTAKDVILDLLGWGVPPEYLVDCGLSREIIYYVFTELNLRFPHNFDPYDLFMYQGSPEPLTPPFVDPAPRSGPPSAPSPISIPLRPIQGHPSLPQKPTAPQGTTSPAPSSATSPTLLQSAPSLLDMEQQRKQELLARKAVYASRKPKTSGATFGSSKESHTDQSSTSKQSEASQPVALNATVDDFLNSIGSVHSDASDDKAPLSRAQSLNGMDVDEPPGLSGFQEAAPSDVVSRSSISMSVKSDPLSPTVSTYPSQSLPRPVPHSQSPGSTPGPLSNTDSHTSTTSYPTVSSTTSNGQRRGMKRPVAADFVDLEPGSSRYHAANGYSSSSYRHSNVRQKTSSFAGVASGMRRMVINLSDTEDEDDETDIENGDGTPGYSTSVIATRPIRPPPRYARRYEQASRSARITPPTSLTPALLEKEQEIRRMKEQIAAREKMMQKKLAAVSCYTYVQFIATNIVVSPVFNGFNSSSTQQCSCRRERQA